eukprot:5617768-Pleurochrysis_carterae.AAC.1
MHLTTVVAALEAEQVCAVLECAASLCRLISSICSRAQSEDVMDGVIQEMRKQLWPTCKMVHGRARHTERQGGIERLNRMVESKLGIWMQVNNTTRWSFGRTIVHWQNNIDFSPSVGQLLNVLAIQSSVGGQGHRSCALLVQRWMRWEDMLALQGQAQVQLTLPQGQREVQES